MTIDTAMAGLSFLVGMGSVVIACICLYDVNKQCKTNPSTLLRWQRALCLASLALTGICLVLWFLTVVGGHVNQVLLSRTFGTNILILTALAAIRWKDDPDLWHLWKKSAGGWMLILGTGMGVLGLCGGFSLYEEDNIHESISYPEEYWTPGNSTITPLIDKYLMQRRGRMVRTDIYNDTTYLLMTVGDMPTVGGSSMRVNIVGHLGQPIPLRDELIDTLQLRPLGVATSERIRITMFADQRISSKKLEKLTKGFSFTPQEIDDYHLSWDEVDAIYDNAMYFVITDGKVAKCGSIK